MWLENHNESIRCDNAIFFFVICLNKTNTYSSEWVLISCVNAQRINVAVYSIETRALIHSQHNSVCLIFDQLELYLFILCMRDHWTKKLKRKKGRKQLLSSPHWRREQKLLLLFWGKEKNSREKRKKKKYTTTTAITTIQERKKNNTTNHNFSTVIQ